MCSYVLKNISWTRRVMSEFLNHNRTVTYSQLKQRRQISDNPKNKCEDQNNLQKDDDHNLTSAINSKYKIFHEQHADIIFDVSEEQQKIKLEDLNVQKEFHDPYADVNLKHGISGVFDIEELVTLLKRDKAQNIFVASVPKEYAYVDYIVVINGQSRKHMNALATFVRKVYKLKRRPTDLIPKIEGEKSDEWMALDLGNIALHIFSASGRARYDLETLWTVGSQYDDKTNMLEELDIMDQYNTFLTDLQPVDD